MATTTTPWYSTLIGTGVGALGNYLAAQAAASGSAEAAQIGSRASAYATDAQTRAAQNALAFQQQQAQQDFANAQATRQGNYGQWAAREARLSTLGQMLGQQPWQIPNYVPLVNTLPTAGTINNSPITLVSPLSTPTTTYHTQGPGTTPAGYAIPRTSANPAVAT